MGTTRLAIAFGTGLIGLVYLVIAISTLVTGMIEVWPTEVTAIGETGSVVTYDGKEHTQTALGSNEEGGGHITCFNKNGEIQVNLGGDMDAGLYVDTPSEQHSSTVAPGYVIDQTPAAGESLPRESIISLVVSLGPSTPDPDEPSPINTQSDTAAEGRAGEAATEPE